MPSPRHQQQIVTESFWFFPALLLIAAAALAEGMVALDRSLVGDGVAQWPFVNAIGPSGSRDLLAAIGGSMLGVAATSFSITISVIATASSTYGPRLVRNFMANRGNQIVLGIFGATFLYALMVLRTVREESSTAPEFVPHLAVTVAIALAVVDVAVLIYFIHHIADSIQVSTLVSQVLRDLERAVAQPQPDGHTIVTPAAVLPAGKPSHVVTADGHGYLQHVDHAALITLATDIDGIIHLRPRCGDHVLAGDVLAEVWARPDVDVPVDQRVRRHIDLGRARTPTQDLRYATQQIVEMAVRALSPSTNDPYTGLNAITELNVALAAVIDRDDPGNGYRRKGHWRLLAAPVGAAELVDLAFDQLRGCALSYPDVVSALLQLCSTLSARTQRPDVRAALDRQATALQRQFLATGPDHRDRDRIGLQ